MYFRNWLGNHRLLPVIDHSQSQSCSLKWHALAKIWDALPIPLCLQARTSQALQSFPLHEYRSQNPQELHYLRISLFDGFPKTLRMKYLLSACPSARLWGSWSRTRLCRRYSRLKMKQSKTYRRWDENKIPTVSLSLEKTRCQHLLVIQSKWYETSLWRTPDVVKQSKTRRHTCRKFNSCFHT